MATSPVKNWLSLKQDLHFTLVILPLDQVKLHENNKNETNNNNNNNKIILSLCQALCQFIYVHYINTLIIKTLFNRKTRNSANTYWGPSLGHYNLMRQLLLFFPIYGWRHWVSKSVIFYIRSHAKYEVELDLECLMPEPKGKAPPCLPWCHL